MKHIPAIVILVSLAALAWYAPLYVFPALWVLSNFLFGHR